MFNSFGAAPRILRVFCKGRVVEREDPQFQPWVERMIESGMKMDRAALQDLGAEPRIHDEENTGAKSHMDLKGIRAAIVLDVFKVQTSCGFGVPVFPNRSSAAAGEEQGTDEKPGWKTWDDRPTMPQWSSKMAEKDALEKWRVQYNTRSLDGCPGLVSARRDEQQWLWIEAVRARLLRIVVGQWDAFLSGALAMFLLVILFRVQLL
jgi:hypothetical protein